MSQLPSSSRPLRELTTLFLKLGITAFGGPAAHIAMMEDEVVRRRQWLSRDEFLDLLGATNLIPGPNSTEMAIHIGHRRGGWPGLIVAGACFILPAAIIVTAIAWAYVTFGKLPNAQGILYGVKPVVIAVVFQALLGLGRAALKTPFLTAAGGVAVAAGFLGVNELLILFAGGLWVALVEAGFRGKRPGPRVGLLAAAPLVPVPMMAAATGVGAPFGLGAMFLFFLKIGSVLFGSGYVLLAFLRADLVDRWQWLTEAQLLDAIAVGQFTPGPVFTTATFIGYVLAGWSGAGLATLGIFLPAFVFVALSGPLVPRIRRSPFAGAFLDGVNVTSLALMAVVTWHLGRSAMSDVLTVGLALVSAALLLRYRINSAWLVLGGAIIGLIVTSLGG